MFSNSQITCIKDTLEAEKRQSESKLQQTESELSKLKSLFEEALAQVAALKKDLSGAQSVSKDASRLTGENASLKEEQASLKKENASLKDEHASLKKENAALKEEHASLKREEASLKEAHASFRTENASLKEELSQLKTRNDQLHQKNWSTVEGLNQAEKKFSDLQRKVLEDEEKTRKLLIQAFPKEAAGDLKDLEGDEFVKNVVQQLKLQLRETDKLKAEIGSLKTSLSKAEEALAAAHAAAREAATSAKVAPAAETSAPVAQLAGADDKLHRQDEDANEEVCTPKGLRFNDLSYVSSPLRVMLQVRVPMHSRDRAFPCGVQKAHQ